jgi:2-polyprenyl-3-methyl-5-hydroxy-6-metoxy-1,4-benzoquinol methylase
MCPFSASRDRGRLIQETDPVDSEQLRGHFNRHAAEFDVLYDSKRQSGLERWLNRKFRSDIVARHEAAIAHVRSIDAKSVLDVGCGPGHYLASLSKIGVSRLVGVDVSEQMIELAQNHPDISKSVAIELISADYLTWQSDEKFDVVLALGFFDYVRDPLPVLEKMHVQAMHSVFASFPSQHWIRTPFRWLRRRLQGTHVYFYSEAQIRELAVKSGFAGVDITRLPGAGMNVLAVFRRN